MFKGDTVSEKFNKAENHPGCQICLPKPKYPECLLLTVTREKKKAQYFSQAKRKKIHFLEKRNSVSALVWVLEVK